MAVVKVGNDYFNTVTGRKITGPNAHAELMAEIKRAGQVGIPTRSHQIVGNRIAENERTPARAAHKAAGISGGFIGHAEAPKATDGQSLASQGADVIATYTSVHGDNAYSQWVKDHNRETGAGPVRVTPPGTDPKSGFPGETDDQQLHRLRAALSQRRVADLRDKGASFIPEDFETWSLAATQDWFNAQKERWGTGPEGTGIVAGLLGESDESTTIQPGDPTGNEDVDESLKTLNLAGGIEERKLAAKIAADAAQNAYLQRRLNFDTEDAARSAAMQAARDVISERSLNRQFGLDVGNFLMQARGPRNFGQLFNIYGGDPATESGLPRRLLNVLTGAGPVGATPNTAVSAGTQLGFGEQLRQIFGGGGQVNADEVLSKLINGPQQTAPQFGTDPTTGRAGFTLDPRNLNPVQVANLQPSEREAHGSLFESGGFPIADVEEMLNRMLPNAPRVASPRLGTVGLRT